MSDVYSKSKVWLTIDVEELTDTNFNICWIKRKEIDYDVLIQNWIDLCEDLDYKSTCFVLGSFAQKYPNLVKRLSENGHEIASHGYDHQLVNAMKLADWEQSIIHSKKILEELIGKPVNGYRAASWSMPFEKEYYAILAKNGYRYSSSYFPMKTYMYGNTIDRKRPFEIASDSGVVTEFPIPKYGIPFSGGFYLRVVPTSIARYLYNKLLKLGIQPIVYIHPYELMDNNMLLFFNKNASKNLDYLLAFFSTQQPRKKILDILSSI